MMIGVKNMDERKEIDRREIKSDPSKVGVAIIKYGAILVIFFAILWFIITYIL